MNKRNPFLITIGLLASSLVLGSSTPQSFLDGYPQTKTDNQLTPVRIVGVDGEMQHDNPVGVYPGPRWLEIQAVPWGDTGKGRESKPQTYVMKIEPCTHYYLGAHRESLAIDKWKLVVDKKETVSACDPAEELKKAEANPPRGGKAHPPQH